MGADRRGPRTSLTAKVLQHFGVSRPQDLIHEIYYGGMKPGGIAALASELETFFKDVLVNVEDQDVRTNRLSLLRKVGGAAMKIADVTKIVVDRRDYRA